MKYLIKEVKVTEEEINQEIENLLHEKTIIMNRMAAVCDRIEELGQSKSKLKEE